MHITHDLHRLSTRSGLMLGLCALLALTGCSRMEGFPKPQLVAEPDPVVARLAAAADRAANALDELAAIENTRTPTEIPPLVNTAPIELRRAITIDWVGNAEPLVQQLADRASYQFKLTGQPSALPLIVTIRVRNQPIIETLRDLGLQLENRATLRVDTDTQTIELVYAANTPAPIMAPITDLSDEINSFSASPAEPGPALPPPVIASETLVDPFTEKKIEIGKDDNDAAQLPSSPL